MGRYILHVPDACRFDEAVRRVERDGLQVDFVSKRSRIISIENTTPSELSTRFGDLAPEIEEDIQHMRD